MLPLFPYLRALRYLGSESTFAVVNLVCSYNCVYKDIVQQFISRHVSQTNTDARTNDIIINYLQRESTSSHRSISISGLIYSNSIHHRSRLSSTRQEKHAQ